MLSKGRADELRIMPLQDTDLLLHEAGVPPLHTTFAELDKLPNRVKKRMYVVHSSNIPEEFDLRKAPTGTAGTLRLDELPKDGVKMAQRGVSKFANANANTNDVVRFEDDEVNSPWDSAGGEYMDIEERNGDQVDSVTSSNETSMGRSSMITPGRKSIIPLVSLRPTSNTDSWYMLNLLQAVPFLTRYVAYYLIRLLLVSHCGHIRLLNFLCPFLFQVYHIHLRWKYWSQLELRPLTKMMLSCQRLAETRFCVLFGKVHALNVK